MSILGILKEHWKILFFFIVLFLVSDFFQTIEPLTLNIEDMDLNEKMKAFEDLMKSFNEIFPDGNRNAGGPQFFKHIVDLGLSKDNFELYNSFYCGVSGSPVSPDRGKVYDYIVVKDMDGNDVRGKYYRCCWPCLCDVMKYTRVDKFDITLDGQKRTYDVLTIKDPCCNESEIPKSVTAYNCKSNKTQNGIYSRSGRLIFALFYTDDKGQTKDIDSVLDQCKERMETPPDELQGGMGDIFVKLSLLCEDNVEGFTDTHDNLKNIYGEPLKKCKTGDSPGSWDSQGYCSERGGGVHQICMEVTPERGDFSTQTGQGPWSQDRVGNNHCMCLGAWALYKAKGKGDGDELQCESIPDYSLSPEYITKWNTWNGHQLTDQIKNGVDSMVQQCYNKKNSQYLKDKYDTIRRSYGGWSSVI